MRKEFSISNDKIIVNFTTKYCKTFETLLESEAFRKVLDVYLKSIKNKNTSTFKFLTSSLETDDITEIREHLAKVFKYLTVMGVKEVAKGSPKYEKLVSDKDELIAVVEELYLFWRKLERYTLVDDGRTEEGIGAVSFTEANAEFSNLILKLYRKVEKHIVGIPPKVFRQIPAGGNACIMITPIVWPVPKGYEVLEDIPFIDSILIETPFITYPDRKSVV